MRIILGYKFFTVLTDNGKVFIFSTVYREVFIPAASRLPDNSISEQKHIKNKVIKPLK
jgi:hypothetical protein